MLLTAFMNKIEYIYIYTAIYLYSNKIIFYMHIIYSLVHLAALNYIFAKFYKIKYTYMYCIINIHIYNKKVVIQSTMAFNLIYIKNK